MKETDKRLFSISQAIIAARRDCGMSQEQLGAMIGMSDHSYISKVESGEEIPNLARLLDIADALDVNVGQLLKGISKASSKTQGSDSESDSQ
ncbi:helix-turn-helix domain-containing protein [Slackia heliotrinireducens]|uniref:helix-turn-helix domain-containing protein n=1 Tax=Slackia heliotrinireducens TaxID=84110 RepID=UPI00331531B8